MMSAFHSYNDQLSQVSMKTHLSHILPVADACLVLGESTVKRLVKAVYKFKKNQYPHLYNNNSVNKSTKKKVEDEEKDNEEDSDEEEKIVFKHGDVRPPGYVKKVKKPKPKPKPTKKDILPPKQEIIDEDDEDVTKIVEALFYQASISKNDPLVNNSDYYRETENIPQHILFQLARLTRKQLEPTGFGYVQHQNAGSTTSIGSDRNINMDHSGFDDDNADNNDGKLYSLALDKNSFLKLFVPTCTTPHSGQGGHLGLFDCVAHSLCSSSAQQQHSQQQQQQMQQRRGGGTPKNQQQTPQQQQQQKQVVGSPAAQLNRNDGSNSGVDDNTDDTPVILLPDIIIFFAICREHRALKRRPKSSEPEGGDGYEIMLLAVLAFRIYDSFQKKGMVSRDTIHKFLADIHGEESYKAMPVRKILDKMFTVEKRPEFKHGDTKPKQEQQSSKKKIAPMATMVHSLSASQFCAGITETMPPDGSSTSHILLDWITILCNAMLPTFGLTPTTSMYINKIRSSNKSISKLCTAYGLSECKLYEIKRRFHSLVESSNVLTTNSSNTGGSSGKTGDDGNNSDIGDDGDHNLPMSEQDGKATASNSTKIDNLAAAAQRPRHVITQDAFVNAVSQSNDELGHGGYLPERLARLAYRAGCPSSSSSETDSDETNVAATITTFSPSSYWSMYDALQFGFNAVRIDVQEDSILLQDSSRNEKDARLVCDLPLLKFIYQSFTLLSNGSLNDNTAVEADKDDASSLQTTKTDVKNLFLNRNQIGNMLLLLLEHSAFRSEADLPSNDPDGDSNNGDDDKSTGERDGEESRSPNDDIENSLVDISAASQLGICPPDVNATSSDMKVKLALLIDYVLEDSLRDDDNETNKGVITNGTDITRSNGLSFDGFIKWNYNPSGDNQNLSITQRRLGPYMMDLRLVASVLFGIPPSRASMESLVFDELQRRHKSRYPQTDVSRRGPKGTVWYLIDESWHGRWQECVKEKMKPDADAADGRDEMNGKPRGLGRINNTILLAANGSLALRPNIRWKQDYDIVAPLAWSALQAWYDGGPPIYRTVVPYVPADGSKSVHSKQSMRIRTENEIELYPFFVSVFLCDAASRGEARPFQQSVPLSRVSPVRVLLIQLCKGLGVDPKYGRLWMMANTNDIAVQGGGGSDANVNIHGGSEHGKGQRDWLLDLDVNITGQQHHRASGETLGKIGDGQALVLLLELKDEETDKWPRGIDGTTWTFKQGGRDAKVGDDALGDGIVGLYNMGNTCYLNSSVQCLSHTPIFRDYFTAKAYLNDINTTNPLGHQGRLAQVSAVLINSLWKRFGSQSIVHNSKKVTAPGLYSPVNAPALTPKTFKEALGKFNDHFAGNEQHDAQELLAFLLGGLSEDLNRIVDKPYIEQPDSDGRPDGELADIWWSNHLKREMSIIVALFTGQYKSLLTCRSCKYESARFEPFSFLQLPLPEDDNITVSLVLYPLRDGAKTMKYSLRVNHSGKLLDVLVALAKVLHSDAIAAKDENEKESVEIKDNPDEKSEANEKRQKAYHRIAQNMAVVDMREGFIFKIAPNSWALPDLQNKDTGELPLLHIYELEPLPLLDEANQSQTENDQKSEEEDLEDEGKSSKEVKQGGESADVKYSFLAIAQRMTEVVSPDHLHPFAHKVLGTPLLLRVVDLEGYTGRDLYDLIANRVRNLVPKSALKFLEDRVDTSAQDAKKEKDSDDAENITPRTGSRQRRHRTTSDMEEVASGDVPRYGFRLRITSRDGRRCALCPWYVCCIGCLVPDDDYPTIAMCGDSLVLDWHFAVDIATSAFGLRNQTDGTPVPAVLRSRTTSVSVTNHESCGQGSKKAGSITLEECLDSFAKEEKIPEAYCSKCTDFRVQTKRMSLWRLPPVVIIHLKRFQFTQHMRRKLRELVVFPVEGLDLSRIMAADSLENLNQSGDDATVTTTATAASTTAETNVSDGKDEDPDEVSSSKGLPPKSLSSSMDDGRSEMLYDLYGVVHHQGALSGGHYVASLKSEMDGQWRLFNDAQVYEINSRDVVDSSAYILFYIRRDVKNSKLGDFWDITGREGEGLTEDEVEQLMKGRSDRCVIS